MEGTPQQPHSPQAVPAGWYPDPAGQGLRYWDGSGWTTHTAPGAGGRQGEAAAGGGGQAAAASAGQAAAGGQQGAPAAGQQGATPVPGQGPGTAAAPASTADSPAPASSGHDAPDADESEGASRQEWIRSGLIGLIPLAGLVWGVYLVRKEDGREGPGNLAVILSLTVILILILLFR